MDKLIGSQVKTVAWFRRGIMPWVDLISLKNSNVTVNSYPRFWKFILGGLAFVIGVLILT